MARAYHPRNLEIAPAVHFSAGFFLAPETLYGAHTIRPTRQELDVIPWRAILVVLRGSAQ